MSTEDRTGQIIQLLNELIDLVKANAPKVENHTHHHYPATPQYYYPNSPGYQPHWYTAGSGTTTNVPGITTSWSTNDSSSDTTWSTNDPPPDGIDSSPK